MKINALAESEVMPEVDPAFDPDFDLDQAPDLDSKVRLWVEGWGDDWVGIGLKCAGVATKSNSPQRQRQRR